MVRYIRSEASFYMPIYAIDPFMEFEAAHIPLVTEQIPPGELVIGDRRISIDQDPAGALAELHHAYRENLSASLPQLPTFP